MFSRTSCKILSDYLLLEDCFRVKPIHRGEIRRRFSSSSNSEILSSNFSFTKAPCMQHWRKNWENQRRNRLTSSTFAQAIGFWPNRRVQLWLETIGASEPFSGNAATCWTNFKEKEALKRYHAITGHYFLLPEFVALEEEDDDVNWLGASSDADILVVGKDGSCSKGVLEVKCPFYDGDKTQACPWKKVPWHYVPQAQGLMEIMDRDWLDLYCWTVNGSSLFRIERDSVFWGDMKLTLVDFWEKHVVPGRDKFNSSLVITDPLVELIDFVPESRHERCNQILRGTERIMDNSRCLYYERINERM
ncbi:hypothetical protein EUTSA_v10008303mg [Eutrema salsugineum]|uniref:YqaJ viral recombinase domain-containing protein n=1 Tax=Eutrema salsugineum TaxID=72664 RepID=V4KVN9_EUTSA|nr:uncharacterized protein LOC18993483 [Eutrema salsugineum]ESQ35429.1 hypothetical protein EUTSA_v10008303mg [Eutrema salsugineum]